MDQPNEVCDTIMRELNDLVLSDTDESKEQLSFSSHEEVCMTLASRTLK